MSQKGSMFGAGVVVITIAALAGCTTPEQRLAGWASTCEKSGFSKGTGEFAACMSYLQAEREREKDRSLLLMGAGLRMMQTPPPQPASQSVSPASGTTIYNIQGRTLTCIRNGPFVNCN